MIEFLYQQKNMLRREYQLNVLDNLTTKTPSVPKVIQMVTSLSNDQQFM